MDNSSLEELLFLKQKSRLLKDIKSPLEKSMIQFLRSLRFRGYWEAQKDLLIKGEAFKVYMTCIGHVEPETAIDAAIAFRPGYIF